MAGPFLLLEQPTDWSIDIDPAVRFIRFNRPEKKNALTQEMGVHFKNAISELKQDSNCRVVVLTGEGDCFSAGGDFKFLEQRCNDTADNNQAVMKSFYDSFLCLRTLNVPVIAAVQGHAIGAGLALALSSDLRLVSQDAKLGLTFVRLGLHPGMGSTFFTPRALGQQRAWWALLTGNRFSGTEAVQWGMFLQALAPDQVVPAAIALANDIAHLSPNAVQTTLKTLRDQEGPLLEATLWKEALGQSLCYGHSDMNEGLAAIQEKRKPRFP